MSEDSEDVNNKLENVVHSSIQSLSHQVMEASKYVNSNLEERENVF